MSIYQEIKNSLVDLLAKADEFSESHRAFGLPDDFLNTLKDDLDTEANLNTTSR